MNYYIIWFTDNDGEKEYETYTIILAENKEDAEKKAVQIAGDYVISVERYNP